MRFEYEWVLLGLLIVPVFVGTRILDSARRKRLTASLGTARLVAPLLASVDEGRRRLKTVLLSIALALLVLAAARPQTEGEKKVLARRGIDVAIALDLSRSMLAQDLAPSRLQWAKHELPRLLDMLEGDRVGIVGFAGDAYVACPLTLDQHLARLYLDTMDVGDAPTPGTSLSIAIKTATELLEKGRSDAAREPATSAEADDEGRRARVIVLVTDGEGHDEDPVKDAEAARKRGIRVFAVGLGTEVGGPVPETLEDGTPAGVLRDKQSNEVVMTKMKTSTLAGIAKVGAGDAFFVDPVKGVDLAALDARLKQLARGDISDRLETRYEDRFPFFLFPAFFLFLLDAVMRERRREEKRNHRDTPENDREPSAEHGSELHESNWCRGSAAQLGRSEEEEKGGRKKESAVAGAAR
ncbi:MAG: VWA domain-containing protein [Deltaproteobacteria bacterium]|nr:VWA domain-containing protein [Deltaproteobacteria bacterium]